MAEIETPRKRKRDCEARSFANAAFSSTPNKPIATARRQLQQSAPKPAPRIIIGGNENSNPNPFFVSAGLEVKSVADAAAQDCGNANPFEVVRKPPKKKKRDAEIAEACFENAALNLECPEKQFNPFEVVRTPIVPRQQCFINAALNLRGQDASAARNPYEIHRIRVEETTDAKNDGVTNLALEDVANGTGGGDGSAAPTRLQIGLPFTPTVGCRIDFKNVSLSQLTPSRLLADKLVFSPVPPPKRSLDSVSEASTTLDIGKELDRYQLELENSINEAKMRRNGVEMVGDEKLTLSPERIVRAVEQKVTFTQKLAEIAESDEADETAQELHEQRVCEAQAQIVTKSIVKIEDKRLDATTATVKTIHTNVENVETEAKEDVAYASESDEEDLDDFTFKAPARFVRAYRHDNATAASKLTVSKESLNSLKSHESQGSTESGVDEEQHKKTKNVKNLIRRSIRKLMHPLHTKDASATAEAQPIEPQQPQVKQKAPSNIINTLRHSLRRKPGKQLLVEDTEEDGEHNGDDCGTKKASANISIVDTSERTMKLKTQLPHIEYARIEELTNERKHSLRSSLRHSTRGMRDHFMRTVFHKKHEEYAFCK